VGVREELWKVSFGEYRCERCGEPMLSLVNDFEEIPIYCPYCCRPKQKTLSAYIRNIAHNVSLLEELQKHLL